MATKKVDVRRLMREKKGSTNAAKEINSPLARYNSSGQLFCVLCNAPVKSELLWDAHVHGKKHKENLSQLKNKSNPSGAAGMESISETVPKNPVKSSSSSTFLKPLVDGYKKRHTEFAEHGGAPLKKVKVTTDCDEPENLRNLPKDFFVEPSKGQPATVDESKSSESLSASDRIKQSQNQTKAHTSTASSLPADFFDAPTTQESPTNKEPNPPSKGSSSDSLPEGFFDDPKLDAKVRNVEYKDPVEQEWEKFQREMQVENQVSEAIVEEDDEEATFDRELMELSEQRLYYLRADALRDKQALVQQQMEKRATQGQKLLEQQEDDSDSDEFEDLLDWRAKRMS